MLFLSGFELYSRWVPLFYGILESVSNELKTAAVCLRLRYSFLCICLPASATQQRS